MNKLRFLRLLESRIGGSRTQEGSRRIVRGYDEVACRFDAVCRSKIVSRMDQFRTHNAIALSLRN
jgi:hypothetical protein